MRWLGTLFWLVVGALLVTVGLANREVVTLRLMPKPLADAAGIDRYVDLPLFLVVIGGFALGMLFGFVWEWIREIPERAEARATAREMARLRAELARARPAEGDVLALLDAPPAP